MAPTLTAAHRTCMGAPGRGGLRDVIPEELVEQFLKDNAGYVLRLKNGAWVTCYSAETPDNLRGPNLSGAWLDELSSWRYEETYDNLMAALRVGERPQWYVTTTPKPTRLMRRILEDPDAIIVEGATFDNKANLPDSYLKELSKYEGTALYRQEVLGQYVEEIPGALWTNGMIDAAQNPPMFNMRDIVRTVISVDPGVKEGMGGDMHGISVAALMRDNSIAVLADLSLSGSTVDWCTRVFHAQRYYHAGKIMVEGNNGGEALKVSLQSVARELGGYELPVSLHYAKGSKADRAAVVAPLYGIERDGEVIQNRVKHYGPILPEYDGEPFGELEQQMLDMTSVGFTGSGSPDRLDALVHALNELAFGGAVVSRKPRSISFAGLSGPTQKMYNRRP